MGMVNLNILRQLSVVVATEKKSFTLNGSECSSPCKNASTYTSPQMVNIYIK